MKKQKILQMLLIIGSALLFLSGCDTFKSNKIIVPLRTETTITSDNYMKNMTIDYHKAFTIGKKSFVLYFGSERCGHCRELEPLLLNYVSKVKIEIYYVDMWGQDYNENIGYYYEKTEVSVTPYFLIYKDGEIVFRNRGTSNLQTQIDVDKFFKQHVKTTSLFVIDNKEEMTPTADKYVTFSYNFNNIDHQTLINENFFPLFAKKGYTNYLFDSDVTLELPTLRYGNDDEVISISSDSTELKTIITEYKTYFS
ncbi:MAG: thioredoxin family protein [Bacilli bacterium]|jgi:predicted bacteriocin transport accessory protein